MPVTTEIPPGSVLAGVDGSDSALDAVRWAAARARVLRQPLHLVHATVWPLVTHPAPPGVPAHYRKTMLDAAREWLRRAGQLAAQEFPELPIADHLLTGDVGPVLVGLSDRAHEIVVGSRGLGGLTGMLAGSVTMALTQHARCPVVIVRPEGDPHGPVVVGVDGSARNERAVEYAFDAAQRASAPLVALRIWSDVSVGSSCAAPGWDAAEYDEHRRLVELLARWAERFPEVVVRPVVARDQPAERLRDAGRDARLLVVGSRGRGGFSGLLLGSTSRALVQHAPCPLAVVPGASR